ncbi:hypothetical protein PACTADRAFT_35923 [Pachysolen tannophilus NRRL Y-2460]|uniref:DNA-directed RNA polymerases I, II, and III subunit RPABC3 n=1 Tax=Pachysolen tannophilus NRRL Y-2460 TaxID=669874 RepID=A0A1E4TNF4_PACTA|nr:hypothetical protein PACTADRAFT_35923 [Pachysolen tannophilus NRRL Y-2460]
MSSTLFDDTLQVKSVDSARYNKVSRIEATSTTKETTITLDINSELFPVSENDTLTIALAKSLSVDEEDIDEPMTGNVASWRPPKSDERSLADEYDYVMHGTVYKFEEGSNDNISVYISFGGLLMCIDGDYRTLSSLKQENVYILIRRG